MKKKVFGRHLSRDRGSRDALFRSLIKALIEHGTISTTKSKAKAIQADIDGLITQVKKGSLSSKRGIHAYLTNDRRLTEKLFTTVSDRFPDRHGGFTRIVNLPKRVGDNAQVVRLEWSQKAVISDKKQVTSKSKTEKQSLKSKLLRKSAKQDKDVKKKIKSKK